MAALSHSTEEYVLSNITDAPISGLTIVKALLTASITYTNHKGVTVLVPANKHIYVDVAAGVALIDRDHVAICDDEYRRLDN